MDISKCEIMSPAKATDFALLLEVFREGLRYGIISKQEITAWADSIIVVEDEPDYFFIELSLCADINNVFEILNNNTITSDDPIPSRVVLGLLYKKLIDQEISLTDAISVLASVNWYGKITPPERANLYSLDDDYGEIMYQKDEKYAIELTKEITDFLDCYGVFTLNNFKQWGEINEEVEEVLKVRQAKAEAANARWKSANAKRARIKKLRTYILMGVLMILALALVVFDYSAYVSKTIDTKFEVDLYQTGLVYLMIFIPYFMLRVVYGLWRKVKRHA